MLKKRPYRIAIAIVALTLSAMAFAVNYLGSCAQKDWRIVFNSKAECIQAKNTHTLETGHDTSCRVI
jgi:hypothetical protein